MVSAVLESVKQLDEKKLLHELFFQEQQFLKYYFDHVDLDEIETVYRELRNCQGLIMCTGIGKSGLVAQKVAVTMTSTGTRALYVCPSNALHGDIGIVTKDDVFLIFSKSGESDELLELIPYIRNKGAKIISVVCDRHNRQAKASDVTVVLPMEKELCPYNMAPTTSTAIQMIFGDMLAIALMRSKSFSVDQFAMNHPAGRLGKRMSLRVRDLMLSDTNVPLCSKEQKLIDILVELSNKKCGCILITDTDKHLQGIFTDGDLRRALQNHGAEALQMPIETLMSKNPRWIAPDELAVTAVQKMEADQKNAITALAVLTPDRKVLGLIKLHDLVQSGI